jgi:hypothetical protein
VTFFHSEKSNSLLLAGCGTDTVFCRLLWWWHSHGL